LQEQLESIADSIETLAQGYSPLSVKTEMCEEDHSCLAGIIRNLERIADSLQAIERTLQRSKSK
jgi:Mg2+ and Co2+ transporter CorA